VKRADVVIVGGGIIGASAAYFLSKRDLDIKLFDKSGIGREASGSNAGTMAIQNKKIELVPFVRESHRIWNAFQKELGDEIEFRQPGGLRVAEDSEQSEVLHESVKEQKKLGIELELLNPEDLKSFAPYIGPSVVMASFCREDARSNPLTATRAIARAAEARGVEVHEWDPVKSIVVEKENRFLIQTANREIQTSCVLNSAGVWSKQIFKMIGIDLAITLDPMQVMVTERAADIFPHVVTHAKGNMTLKQMDSGNVVIGGGWKSLGDVEKHIKKVKYESMEGNIQYACRVVPALEKLHLIRCWSGLEGRSPDFLPLLGQLTKFPGFYSASCTKGGQTLGPLLGRTIAEIIADGKTTFPMDGCDVNRFIPS
jgi:glycine/D-amino acid oxidase-like deaminating enzyme